MIAITDPFQDQIYINNHLQLDFAKASLNTTCTIQASSLQQSTDLNNNDLDVESLMKSSNILGSQQNSILTKKDKGLNRKSRCFMKQISKVLKKNKIKNNPKTNQNNKQISNQSYLKHNNESSTMAFKPAVSNKGSKANVETKKITNAEKSKKENFNFQLFLQNMVKTKSTQDKLLIENHSDKKITQRKNHQKNKTLFNFDFRKSQRTQNLQISNLRPNNAEISVLKQKSIQFSCKDLNSKRTNHLTFIKFVQDLQNKQNDKSRIQIQTVKSSRAMTIKQSRRLQNQRKNHEQNLKLQRQLKRAMSNVSMNMQNLEQESKQKTQRPRIITKQLEQKPLNNAQIMQNIHFDKLKQKVMGKMQDYKKIKQIRDHEQKQKKKFQKKRTFSAQPKLQLTVEGTNVALNKYNSNNSNDNEYKHRRPFTALSRTGLQYDRRQSHRRRSSDKEYRIECLAGVNNSANHFRTFSKNAHRQIEELHECKSDRVVRKLRQKYNSRPQTARSKNQVSRPSTGTVRKSVKKEQIQEEMFSRNQFGKVTKKGIQKQKMKQKLLGLLVECQQEKIYNENLKQGLNIFEDYCDNVDQGLKTITEQIDQYIKDEE